MKITCKEIVSVIIIYFVLLTGCKTPPQRTAETPETDSLSAVFGQEFKSNILDVWYPRMVDTSDGGFLSNASFDWEIAEKQPKMLVTQSRHLWTASQAGLFYNDSVYTRLARHGFEFLTCKMWDETHGGFFNIRAKDGSHTPEMYGDNKMAYGNAFAIYGLSSYFSLTNDSTALAFAKKTFLWLEKFSHDPVYGGYVDAMDRTGTWLARISGTEKPAIKDFNSSIHLMEAFTGLYKIWPDPLVRTRLEEMLTLVRDTFTNEKGYLNLNFTENWTLVSLRDSSEEVVLRKKGMDHISFGHDVETAFLLLEASHALGIENDTTTLKIAKKLVDHSLANGFDHTIGGFYNQGFYFPGRDTVTILSKNAEWWGQAEGLNALLMMSKIFPGERKYYDAFLKTWSYIDHYLIDKKFGEWYINGQNYNPDVVKAPKASVWKGNYHNGRTMMNCIRMLRDENEVVGHFSKLQLHPQK